MVPCSCVLLQVSSCAMTATQCRMQPTAVQYCCMCSTLAKSACPVRNAGYNSSCSINQLRGQYEPGSYTVCMKGFVFNCVCLFVCV